jgi:hypothetical protein
MIRVTSTPDGPPFTLLAGANGPVVYLDNWAIGNLAEGDPARRDRFIATVRSGVELLFSVTNAAELSGPQGKSADAVRAFLDEMGAHWIPVELSPIEVIKRELAGGNGGMSPCVSERFMKDYFVHLLRDYSPGSGRLIALSGDFFRLGAVLDWVGPQRDSIRQGSSDMDEALRNKYLEVAAMSKSNAVWLDQRFPRVPFDSSRPAHFVYQNLLRLLIKEAHGFGKNDALDFCHAVMASAYGSFATLDRRWKHKIGTLPKPNNLARIYSPPELDQMVSDIELWLTSSTRAAGN